MIRYLLILVLIISISLSAGTLKNLGKGSRSPVSDKIYAMQVFCSEMREIYHEIAYCMVRFGNLIESDDLGKEHRDILLYSSSTPYTKTEGLKRIMDQLSSEAGQADITTLVNIAKTEIDLAQPLILKIMASFVFASNFDDPQMLKDAKKNFNDWKTKVVPALDQVQDIISASKVYMMSSYETPIPNLIHDLVFALEYDKTHFAQLQTAIDDYWSKAQSGSWSDLRQVLEFAKEDKHKSLGYDVNRSYFLLADGGKAKLCNDVISASLVGQVILNEMIMKIPEDGTAPGQEEQLMLEAAMQAYKNAVKDISAGMDSLYAAMEASAQTPWTGGHFPPTPLYVEDLVITINKVLNPAGM